jgi:hypothetical protein
MQNDTFKLVSLNSSVLCLTSFPPYVNVPISFCGFRGFAGCYVIVCVGMEGGLVTWVLLYLLFCTVLIVFNSVNSATVLWGKCVICLLDSWYLIVLLNWVTGVVMDYGICLCWLSIYNLGVNEVLQFKNRIHSSYCHIYFWNGVPSRTFLRAVACATDCRHLAMIIIGMKDLKAIYRLLIFISIFLNRWLFLHYYALK